MELRQNVPHMVPDDTRVGRSRPKTEPRPAGGTAPAAPPPERQPTRTVKKLLKREKPDGGRWTRPGPPPEPR